MKRFLISFDEGTMVIPDEDLPAVSQAARAVVADARAAGVWIFGAGLLPQRIRIVETDGRMTVGPPSESRTVIGGFSIIQVATEEEALDWAARFAAACRCAQDVRELMFDPES